MENPQQLSTFKRPVTLGDLALGWLVVGLLPVALCIGLLIIGLKNDWPNIEPIVVVLWAVLAFVAFYLCFPKRGWSWSELGFQSLGRRGWHLLWQIPAVIVTGLTVTAIVASVFLDLSPQEDDPVESMFSDVSPVTIGVIASRLILLGPYVEEILFRRLLMGYIETSLAKTMAAGGAFAIAAIVSSLCFAGAHMVPPVMLWAFCLGLGCALLDRFHRNMLAGLALHAVNNSIVTLPVVLAVLN